MNIFLGCLKNFRCNVLFAFQFAGEFPTVFPEDGDLIGGGAEAGAFCPQGIENDKVGIFIMQFFLVKKNNLKKFN